jgi:hypothetical protein
MAQNYTRQSSFSDGDTITASLFNNEYNQLVNAFTYSSTDVDATGHRHDGTSGRRRQHLSNWRPQFLK